ncbi:histone PARylation factor 1 isoform X3 [Acipenser oxyrinchus oxyrinchus]|uniref:Histone PARylation factor 1 isoform X3 n=1 Tax=Acipenser oxyrinchus oxyrinchus TaxID=40147 RepID=A0AAD8GJU3_ACIOX|nr:histone PARylation factor 1 isoform X3 [Acipenser oxyrinchus oxyrinchus]
MTGRGKRKSKSAQQELKAVNGNVKKVKQHEEADVPNELRQEVNRLYQLAMPEDFYHFWVFCEKLNPEDPSGALKPSLGLQLVGPYDILAGKHKSAKNSNPNYFLHWRHFYDPPEFQTVLVGNAETQYHMGYYRDSPDALPVFIGANEAKKGCSLSQMGDNMFAAVRLFLTKRQKEKSNKKQDRSLCSLEEELTAAAEKLGYSLEQKSKEMKQRDKKVVTKTFHGAGIAVPVDENDVGYRELPETDASLKKICKVITEAPNDEARIQAFAPIQEMMTYIQFANDECDYGMGYELGIDLFCYGSHYFHKVVRQLLPMAYNLLKRTLFAEIIAAHLASRNQENVDQLSA